MSRTVSCKPPPANSLPLESTANVASRSAPSFCQMRVDSSSPTDLPLARRISQPATSELTVW